MRLKQLLTGAAVVAGVASVTAIAAASVNNEISSDRSTVMACSDAGRAAILHDIDLSRGGQPYMSGQGLSLRAASNGQYLLTSYFAFNASANGNPEDMADSYHYAEYLGSVPRSELIVAAQTFCDTGVFAPSAT